MLLLVFLRIFVSVVSASVVSKRKRFDFLLGKFTLPFHSVLPHIQSCPTIESSHYLLPVHSDIVPEKVKAEDALAEMSVAET